MTGAGTASAKLPVTLLVLVVVALAASGIAPYDRGTWVMEVAPVFIAVPILAFTWRPFPLSDMLYVLIALHALVLIVGGLYTYARVPLGFWMQDWLHLSRNPYDRVGHFMQGFVPALVAREILLRGGFLRSRGMTAFLAICVAMAISACYELVEWAAALALGQGADEFLGTQGDPWDTQEDMFMALIGSTVAMAGFSRLHDARMARIGK